jgi:hypothetical protein
MRRTVAVVLVIVLAGCGGAPAKSAESMAPAMAAPAAPPPGGGGSSQQDRDGDGIPDKADLLASNDVAAAKTVPDSPHSAAMLIYTANLTMAVYQVGPGLDGVERVARESGGYLSSRQDDSVVVRVPRDRFQDVMARIEKLGDVTHRDIKAQDVTDEFVDLQARLKNAYNMRDRLSDLLSHAASKEALDIEKDVVLVNE